jgi:tetratricopeptide (TPR) repeat protein
MALAFQDLGRYQESDATLASLISQNQNTCAYQIAQVYAYRGKVDLAFDWLSRAYRQRDAGICMMKTDLLLRSLRDDPRYVRMLRTLDLPN